MQQRDQRNRIPYDHGQLASVKGPVDQKSRLVVFSVEVGKDHREGAREHFVFKCPSQQRRELSLPPRISNKGALI